MFLRTYHPSPIAFNVGPLAIRWYGLLIVISIILGIWLVIFQAKKYNINKEKILDLSFYLLIFGLIGARLYYILLFPKYFFSHPSDIIKIWQGGLGIFGACFAGLLVIFFYAKKHHLSYLLLLDLIVPALILGQTIGRWGNYFNGELYGRQTGLPWGIPVNSAYFHPCFLYESFWNFAVFLNLIMLQRKKSPFPGEIFSFYLILYPLGRFFVEFIRIDPQPIIFNLRLAQIISLILFISGIVLLFKLRAKAKAQTL